MPDYFRTLIASEYFQKLADFANAGYGLYFAFAFSVFLYVVWVVIAVVTIIFEWAWNRYNDKSSGFQLEELSKLDPELLIVLVHGTWARYAPWTAPNSVFRSALNSRLKSRARLIRFGWSGKNSIRTRERGSLDLKKYLSDLTDSYPQTKIFVVGHSHGGNLVVSALDAQLAQRINGIVCLATPFLVARRRHFDPIASVALALVPIVLIGSITFWLIAPLTWWQIEPIALKPTNWWIVLLIIFSGLVFYLFARLWSNLINVARYDLSFLDPAKILFIRAPGDEASGSLSAAHAISWLVSKLSTVPTRIISLAEERLRVWRKKFARWSTPLFWTCGISWGVALFLIYRDYHPIAIFTVSVFGFVTAFLHTVLNKDQAVVWLTAFCAGAILLTPMVLVIALGGLAVGLEMMLAALFWEVSAEATPPGTWTIIQLGLSATTASSPQLEDWSKELELNSLQHSSVYQNPVALNVVADWIASRSRFGS